MSKTNVAVIYSSSTGGNPYGTSATIGNEGNVVDAENIKPAVYDQAKRVTAVATALKNNL
ncbi:MULTISPECIES: hypothetical protein [Carnobacterium]|uniref:hypothetical protein n=1 Tax=Carnobacterium TaxID=2747 RepID=UPI0019D96E99|nr:hypothetical protein [Carnobacterium maltaromaticum]CAD5899366.1 hypothetical protein CMALT394_250129 [Carnobacterium maltaromaticum]CAD5902370.1 hypothetical protein CMALT430_80221 [Carnobacterium maltaromaticum]